MSRGKSIAEQDNKNHKSGRPAYVVSEADKKTVYELAKKGCNETEIAKALRIAPKTFQRNKDQFTPLIKKGRAKGDPQNIQDVENALLKIARGYNYIEVHHETREAPDGTTVVDRTVKKHVPPNVGAIIFYLCNRAAERWQNTQKVEHKGNIATTAKVLLEDLTKEGVNGKS